MKDKLRELAKDLAEKEKDYAPFERRFSEELLAILDAEGDGGTPLPGVVWNERTDAAHLIKRGTEVEFCAEYGCCRVFTHPARSGVVSDEDVSIARDALMAMRDECAHAGLGPRPRIFREVRAALESYASRHARQVPDVKTATRLAQYGAEYAYGHRDWSIEALQDGCEEHVEGWLKQAAPPAPSEEVE